MFVQAAETGGVFATLTDERYYTGAYKQSRKEPLSSPRSKSPPRTGARPQSAAVRRSLSPRRESHSTPLSPPARRTSEVASTVIEFDISADPQFSGYEYSIRAVFQVRRRALFLPL